MNRNTQPIEPIRHQTDVHLEYVKIWKTIQGEGPFVGMPAIFIRMAGCNLQCPMCDTDYTTDRKWMDIGDAVQVVNSLARTGEGKDVELVVITGGEPFRQDISLLVKNLVNRNYLVQVETNGTCYLNNFPYNETTIVCSPKGPKIHPLLEKHIDSFKYVIRAGDVAPDGLPIHALDSRLPVARPSSKSKRTSIYLQPCDEQDPQRNADNIKVAVDSCLKHGYTLCLQMHKYAGLE